MKLSKHFICTTVIRKLAMLNLSCALSIYIYIPKVHIFNPNE